MQTLLRVVNVASLMALAVTLVVRQFQFSLTSGGRYGVLLLGLKLRENRALAFLLLPQAFFRATPWPFPCLWFDA